MAEKAFQERFSALQQEFLDELGPRIAALRTAWKRFALNHEDRAALETARRTAHHLAGSGSIFGCILVTQTASEIDKLCGGLIDDRRDPTQTERIAIDGAIDELKAQAALPLANNPTFSIHGQAHYSAERADHLVFIVNEDSVQASAMAMTIRESGYKVRIISSPGRLESTIATTRPAVLVMGTVYGKKEALTVLDTKPWRAGGPDESPIRSVLFTSRRDLAETYDVSGFECDAFVEKSQTFVKLVETLDHLIFGEPIGRPRVIALGSDPEALERYQKALEQAGAYVAAVGGVKDLLATESELDPELGLVVLAGAQPGLVEVFDALDASPAGSSMPIVVVPDTAGTAEIAVDKLKIANPVVLDHDEPDAVAADAVGRISARRKAADALGRGAIESLTASADETDEPGKSAEPPVTELPPAPQPERPDLRILVADDDPFARRAIRLKLEESGYEVVEVEDGEAAFDIAANEDVDLIITDQLMPKCTGEQLLIRLAAFPATRHIPTIMVTAHRVSGRTDFALERDVMGRYQSIAYIEKPINFNLLLDAVRHGLAGAAAAGARRTA